MQRFYLCLIALTALSLSSAVLLERDRRDVADSHDHWEHIVRRSVENWPVHRKRYPVEYEPEIANVQSYYKDVLLNEDWDEEEAHSPHRTASTQVLKRDQQKAIPGRYIVMFSPDAGDHHLDRTMELLRYADEKSRRNQWDLRAADFDPIRHVGKGFTATLSSNVVRILWKNPIVNYIEQDVAIKRNSLYDNEATSAVEVPWNLDRIDQHSNVLDGSYSPEGTGEGVDVYIFDTGIRYTHDEFEGRASYGGYDAIDALTGTNRQGLDCNSHGTHCAGTVGGKTYGVAKKATLYSIRVLGCTGSGAISGIIKGLDHVMSSRSTSRRAVISMSLGVRSEHGRHNTFTAAIDNAVSSGIVVVAASGNQGADSCTVSPGNAMKSISVAATKQNDRSAIFSNLGSCVDVFAPGTDIKSAGMDCDNCLATKSGTSMACPHVAGYAAILLGMDNGLTPAQVKERIISHATEGVVSYDSVTSLSMNTPNRLLYVPKSGSDDVDK